MTKTKSKPVEIDPQHYQFEGFRQRMRVADWRQILLNHQELITFNGRIRYLGAKNLGAGVVEICKLPDTGVRPEDTFQGRR